MITSLFVRCHSMLLMLRESLYDDTERMRALNAEEGGGECRNICEQITERTDSKYLNIFPRGRYSLVYEIVLNIFKTFEV